MTGIGPTSQRPAHPDDAAVPTAEAPPASSAVERANRLSAANMIRSLLPLVVICLLLVAWQAFRTSGQDPVREVDPSSTVRLAAERADYAVPAPADLPEGYRPTSARTDAGTAADGGPVTLEIGYLTPSGEFAGFAVSDDPGAQPVRAVLESALEEGMVEVGGQQWTRSTTGRSETVLSREADGVVVVVSGSASDDELRAVAGAVRPVD
ncbi:DUF4245 domain-containing protein [Candidatus Blastococcus massiliensis]|uniref:DUF4245 domain-containing protein n=1 Tax=Candidatus Blastococcus massiliensis TaxID=1470358 RepID=UPI00058C15E1|nr:DUF4245 domain-containing protein [Candidatus Blastococcus massiliensis]